MFRVALCPVIFYDEIMSYHKALRTLWPQFHEGCSIIFLRLIRFYEGILYGMDVICYVTALYNQNYDYTSPRLGCCHTRSLQTYKGSSFHPPKVIQLFHFRWGPCGQTTTSIMGFFLLQSFASWHWTWIWRGLDVYLFSVKRTSKDRTLPWESLNGTVSSPQTPMYILYSE